MRKTPYFLQSDREMMGEVMEQVTELAAEEEKAGRVCAQCGKEIDPVKDGFVMCRDNFIQAKKRPRRAAVFRGFSYVVLNVHYPQGTLTAAPVPM